MALTAKRFTMLSRETNLPVADFTKSLGGDVLNSVENALSEVSDSIKSMLDSAKQSDVMQTLSNIKDEGVRMARDAISSMRDLAKFTEQGIMNIIGNFLPSDNIFKKMFNMLSSKCRKAAASGINFGGGWDINGKCGNGNGKNGCSSEQFNNILNGLSGGLLGDVVKGVGSMINGIMALAKMGFDLGVCGVLSALSSLTGASKSVLGIASGALFGHLGSSGNTLGIMSLANDVLKTGTKVANIVPGAVGLAINGFNSSGIAGALSGTFDRFTGSMSVLAGDNWNKDRSGNLDVSSYAGGNVDYSLASASSGFKNTLSEGQYPSEDAHYAAAVGSKVGSSIYSLV